MLNDKRKRRSTQNRAQYTDCSSNKGRVVRGIWVLSRVLRFYRKGTMDYFNMQAGTGDGFGENFCSDHRTIRVIKLVASTMLSAAVKRRYGSVLAYFVTSLFASFRRNLWTGNKFCKFRPRVTLIEIANTPSDRSAALALSVGLTN